MQCLESRWHQITALHNKCMNGTTSNCCVYVDKSTTKCVIIIFIDEIIMSVVLCCDFQVIFDICHSHCHYRSRLPLAKGAFSHFSEHQCLWSEGGHKLIYSHLCIHTQIIIGLCLLMPRHLSDAVRARCAQRSRNNNGKWLIETTVLHTRDTLLIAEVSTFVLIRHLSGGWWYDSRQPPHFAIRYNFIRSQYRLHTDLWASGQTFRFQDFNFWSGTFDCLKKFIVKSQGISWFD